MAFHLAESYYLIIIIKISKDSSLDSSADTEVRSLAAATYRTLTVMSAGG